jgi:hypothetical protein
MATARDITAHLLAEDGVTAIRFAGDARQLKNVDPFEMHDGDVLQLPDGMVWARPRPMDSFTFGQSPLHLDAD